MSALLRIDDLMDRTDCAQATPFTDSAESIEQPRILIADDDQLIAEIARLQLEHAGYTNVATTNHSASVMSLIAAQPPHVLLLDLQMPQMSGLEILQQIRANPELMAISVIMMTASSDHDDRLEALDLGATDFLSKPVHAGELVARIRNILKAKAFEEQLRTAERQKRLVAEQELRTAEKIQARLFPTSSPDVPGLDIAGRAYSAGNGCGDYFDYFMLANESVGLAVGDVTGHGMPSALRMMESRAYLRSLVHFQTDPGGMLSELNQFMMQDAACADGIEQFMTMFLATIDPESRVLTYASAGHIGYLLRSTGEVVRLTSTGFPLGILDIPLETSESRVLQSGDVLVIATDGIEESMNPAGEQFGASRLLSVVRDSQPCSASEVISKLYSAVESFTAGIPQRDDITAIVVIVG